ncbi:MAG: hypothetical protein QFB86_01290 [Patescibacteria group bacterium]|nr:hypothetical protein [Patescibacteria group bacterium]
MASIYEIAQQTEEVAENVALHTQKFEDIAAELIMRNMAVIMDRLDPNDYSSMDAGTKSKVQAVAIHTRKIAPIEEGELAQMPFESHSEFVYRASVVHPLHKAQRAIAFADFDTYDVEDSKDYRTAVLLAGRGFNAVVGEVGHMTKITRETRYFTGNIAAAAGRMAIVEGAETHDSSSR